MSKLRWMKSKPKQAYGKIVRNTEGVAKIGQPTTQSFTRNNGNLAIPARLQQKNGVVKFVTLKQDLEHFIKNIKYKEFLRER